MRPRLAAAVIAAGGLALAASEAGCTTASTGPSSACPPGQSCQVHLTLLHTADIHSRIFPYSLQILQVDSELGLGTLDEVKTVGGIARVSYVINRERARSDRVLHLDSGDIFEGAPIFNFFNGEPETRAESMMGTDAMVIGNHEFDHGAVNAARQLQKWASFPVLAANYYFTPVQSPYSTEISTVLTPFEVFDLEGLKVGVIGMGNFSSLASVFDSPNSLGMYPLNTVETAQGYVDLLRPYVDVIVVLSHLGLDVDERMVQNTTGIDVVEGGHNHIVIDPPQTVQDCSADQSKPGYVWAVNPNIPYDPNHPVYDPADTAHIHPNEFRRPCVPRKVLISHSGAFAKYVGRFDLTFSNDPTLASPTGDPKDYDPNNKFEVISSSYVPIPIDDKVPEDPRMVDLLQPYQRVLDRVADLNIIAGYSPNGAKRISSQGGDSPLGNMVADSMWLRLGIQTDFAMTNSTGIRTDLIPGPVTIDEMYDIFPFDNSITKMQLSGTEVQEMFDFIARRSGSRGCQTQGQIAGARVILNCAGCNRPNTTGVACTQDAECVGAEPGSCALTCADNATQCATDSDCGPTNGPCSQKCIVNACADEIYIGYETNCPGNASCSCSKDSDCPDNLPGQCVLSSASSTTGQCGAPVQLENVYDFATNNYIAAGGSGFRVLQRNTTQIDSRIQQRDALTDYIRAGHACGYDPNQSTANGLVPCSTDADCTSAGDFVCACPGQVNATGTDTNQICDSSGGNCNGQGSCVLRACRNQVATFHESMCSGSPNLDACDTDLDSCSLAGEECKVLPCVDEKLGAAIDNRILMTGR